MNRIEESGFRFDLGPTITMMPDIYREVFEYCKQDPDDYIKMKKLDPIYQVTFGDGTVHSASSDLTKLTETLEEIGYEETKGYFKYIAEIYERYLVAKDWFIDRAFRKPTDFYNPKTLLAALRLKTFDNAYASVGKFVKDDKLKELLSFQTLYIGVSPFNGPSIYTIIPMIELIYGVWYIEGGMYSMAKGMEQLFLKLGGSVRYNSPVEEIVIEKGQTKGVRVGGEVIEADYVVCSADFPYALHKLLPEGFSQGKYSKKRLSKLEYSCSCYMLYIGLDRADFDGLKVHNLKFSADFKGNLNDIFEGRFPADPSVYVYAPGTVDPTVVPEGKMGLYVLVPVPNLKDGAIDWADEKTERDIRAKVYEKVKAIAPLKDFEDSILFEKVYTPLDWEKDFSAYAGATFGLRPTLVQSNYFRPQPKAKKAQGLYFTGSSAHPGAGVPIVLTSAKLAAQELEKDDR